jgi:hypothetical protein
MKIRLQIQPCMPQVGSCICCGDDVTTTHRDDDLNGFVGDCCAQELKQAEIELIDAQLVPPTQKIYGN